MRMHTVAHEVVSNVLANALSHTVQASRGSSSIAAWSQQKHTHRTTIPSALPLLAAVFIALQSDWAEFETTDGLSACIFTQRMSLNGSPSEPDRSIGWRRNTRCDSTHIKHLLTIPTARHTTHIDQPDEVTTCWMAISGRRTHFPWTVFSSEFS